MPTRRNKVSAQGAGEISHNNLHLKRAYNIYKQTNRTENMMDFFASFADSNALCLLVFRMFLVDTGTR